MQEGTKIHPYVPCTITIYDKHRSKVLQELSVLAMDTATRKIAGEAAWYLAKTNPSPIAGSPFRNSVLAKFNMVTSLLQIDFKKAIYLPFCASQKCGYKIGAKQDWSSKKPLVKLSPKFRLIL